MRQFEIWSRKRLNVRRMRYETIWYWHLISKTNLGNEIIAQGEPDGYHNRGYVEMLIKSLKDLGDVEMVYID